jgi:hypothetical protein
VTFVGAFGSEYVAPCAVGVTSETSSDVTRASEPRPKILRVERVLFMEEFNQPFVSEAISVGYRMVTYRLIFSEPRVIK